MSDIRDEIKKSAIKRDEMIETAIKLKEYCKTQICNIQCLFFNGDDEYGFPKCGIGDPFEWNIKKGEK